MDYSGFVKHCSVFVKFWKKRNRVHTLSCGTNALTSIIELSGEDFSSSFLGGAEAAANTFGTNPANSGDWAHLKTNSLMYGGGNTQLGQREGISATDAMAAAASLGSASTTG